MSHVPTREDSRSRNLPATQNGNRVMLNIPLKLPCGATLKNRVAKSAMTEGIADEYNRATEGHATLYKAWSTGCGLLITGNVQIDRRFVERAGNVCISGVQDKEQLRRLTAFSRAATSGGHHCWMQISHAGRQCDTRVNTEPIGPSNQPVRVPTKPVWPTRQICTDEIERLVEKFAYAAGIAKRCGFTGVQIHSAHGYLLSSFLSPLANTRKDKYGGSLRNRCRFLFDVIEAVRREVGPYFPVSVKLNSADFQRGGFTHEEAIRVARWLDELASLDLLEISGGNYEKPVLLTGLDSEQNEHTSSTLLREAYFIRFAKDIKAELRRTPLMVTGGFRTRKAMDSSLSMGYLDVVGVARPLCGDPHCVDKMLSGNIDALPAWERDIKANVIIEQLARLVSLVKLAKLGLGLQSWCYVNLIRLSQGQDPDLRISLFRCMQIVESFERKKSASLRGAELDGIRGTSLHATPSYNRKTVVMSVAAVGLAALVYASRSKI